MININERPSSRVIAFKTETRRVHPEPENEKIYGVFDPEKNEEDAALVESIKSIGLMQPITVRPDETLAEEYVVVSGHRRLAAHIYAKIPQISVIPIHPHTEEELLQLRAGLVQTNALTRTRTSAIMIKEAEYLKPVMKRLKELDPNKYYGISVRVLIAEKMNVSEKTVARLQKIQNNVEPNTYEAFVKGDVSQNDALKSADREISKGDSEENVSLYIDLKDAYRNKLEDKLIEYLIPDKAMYTLNELQAKDFVDEQIRTRSTKIYKDFQYEFIPHYGCRVTMGKRTTRIQIKDIVPAIMSGLMRKRQIALLTKDVSETEVSVQIESRKAKPMKDDDEHYVYNRLLKKIENVERLMAEYPEMVKTEEFMRAVIKLETLAKKYE